MTSSRALVLSAVLVASFGLSHAAFAGTSRIYITNSAGDSIHVVDPATNKVVQVIKGIEAAHGINFSPDGSRVYVSNEADSTLDVVDRPTGKIIAKVKLSGHPNNIAVTKDGGRVVVGIAEDPGTLDIIDTKALARTKSVPVRGRLHNVYVTPDSKYVITGSVRSKVLTVIDLKTEEPVWWIQFDAGVRPMAIEAAPDGSTSRIFVQLSKLNGFSVVDFATHKEVDRIKLPDQPSGFGAQEDRLDTPSHGIAVAPDGKTLWVTSVLANAVFTYSLPELKLLGHVSLPAQKVAGYEPIGALPDWITFTPDSKTVYVSNSGSRSVSAIDARRRTLIKNIAVGEVPKRINTLVLP